MPPRRMQDFTNKKFNKKSVIKRFVKDFKGKLPTIIAIVVLSIISAVLTIVAAVYMNDIMNITENGILVFDSVNNVIKIDWSLFFLSFGILLTFYLGSAIVSFISQFISVTLSNNYAKDMREKAQRKLERLPLSYFDRVPYGDTLSIITNDVDNVSRNLTSIITQIFTSVTLFLGTLIAMFTVKWQLALVSICSVPLTLLIVLLISKFSSKQFKLYRTQLGVLNGKIEENYAGYKIIKLFNKEEDIEKDFDISNKKLAKSDYLSQFLGGFIYPATILINNITYVAIAVVGGLINDPTSMLTFFLFLNLFNRPFQQLGQIASTIQSVLASGDRVYTLLDEKETAKDGDFIKETLIGETIIDPQELENRFNRKIDNGSKLTFKNHSLNNKYNMNSHVFLKNNELSTIDKIEINKEGKYVVKTYLKEKSIDSEDNIKGSFVFDKVYFSYSPEKPLIQNMNLKVNAGDSIAIVGPTGAGKTTLVNLIMRFYELNGGNIYLDGHPTTYYNLETLRGSIGMVLQDTWLFKGTIKENLLFGDQNATDEEIIEACKKTHIHHFITTLPGGYNFELNEDGNNISQGQRQLLTIARAIISKPKILILDEATSSVDTRTESLIQDALENMMKGRTSFIIAHRLSTIKNAKQIIVMKKGQIVEIGNHNDLLAKNGFYAELYNAQFSGINPMNKVDNDVLES